MKSQIKSGKSILGFSHPDCPPRQNICDASGKPISSLDALEKKVPSDHKGINDITFTFDDAYVNPKWGITKIKEAQYSYEHKIQTNTIRLDVSGFVDAIRKDALNG